MTKYKDVEEKIDEALKLSKKTGKEHLFNICKSDTEITTTNIQEVDKEFAGNMIKCQGMIGSFRVHQGSDDAIQSPKDIISDLQKV